jgi:hypothetical protein
MLTITEDKKIRISFSHTLCNEVHKPIVKKSSKKIPSQDVNVYYPKGCCAQGFCLWGPRVHEEKECKPANCNPCQSINLQLRLKEEIPTCHDARTCPCVPYKKPDERTKMTKKIAHDLYKCYISSGKLSNQIEIENLNRENNIWSVSKTLTKPFNVTMKKVDFNNLFKPKSNVISYASVLLSAKDESSKDESTDSVSTDPLSTDDVSTNSVSTNSVSTDSLSTDSVSSDSVSSGDEFSEDESSEVVSSEVVSSGDEFSEDESSEVVSSEVVSSEDESPEVVSLVDESSEVVSLVDESSEVKSIRLLLLKFQNLERVLINTGNGNKDDFESISKSIFSLTEKLKTIV